MWFSGAIDSLSSAKKNKWSQNVVEAWQFLWKAQFVLAHNARIKAETGLNCDFIHTINLIPFEWL